MIRDGTNFLDSDGLHMYKYRITGQLLTKVQEMKLQHLRGKLEKCGHPVAPSSPVPVVEGTPVSQNVDQNTCDIIYIHLHLYHSLFAINILED